MVGPRDEGDFLRTGVPIDGRTGRNLAIGFGDVEDADHGETAEGMGFDVESGDADQIGDDDDVTRGDSGVGTIVDGISLLNVTSEHCVLSPCEI